jgi:hypothetical protein
MQWHITIWEMPIITKANMTTQAKALIGTKSNDNRVVGDRGVGKLARPISGRKSTTGRFTNNHFNY